MPSPFAMHRFWKFLCKNWPDDDKVNRKIFNYVNKYISPFHLDGLPKKKQYKQYAQRRIHLLELHERSKGRKPILCAEIENELYIPTLDPPTLKKLKEQKKEETNNGED